MIYLDNIAASFTEDAVLDVFVILLENIMLIRILHTS